MKVSVLMVPGFGFRVAYCRVLGLDFRVAYCRVRGFGFHPSWAGSFSERLRMALHDEQSAESTSTRCNAMDHVSRS